MDLHVLTGTMVQPQSNQIKVLSVHATYWCHVPNAVCVCARTAVGARFCKKELGGQFPKHFLHLTQSSHLLDGHPHFAPPCAGCL